MRSGRRQRGSPVEDLAGSRWDEAAGEPAQRGFAAAGLPHQPQAVATVQPEINIRDCPEFSCFAEGMLADGKGPRDLPQFQKRWHASSVFFLIFHQLALSETLASAKVAIWV